MPNSARYWATAIHSPWTPPPILAPEVSPDRRYPPVIQTADWTCSCASLAWVMSALGVPSPSRGQGFAWTEWDGVAEVRRCSGSQIAVDPSYGLAYGNGQDLEATYHEYGFEVDRRLVMDWYEAALLSARFIGQFGGGRWYHWTGARWFDPAQNVFQLANPAPSWNRSGNSR
jgi:hypothetical protein